LLRGIVTWRALSRCGWYAWPLVLAACGANADAIGEAPADDAGARNDPSADGGSTDGSRVDDPRDAAAGGEAGGGDTKRVAVGAGKTANAELVQTLSVGTSASGAERRVVMRLDPTDLPALATGDRLSAPAEAQVTTRCDVGQVAPGCGYSPMVGAELVLTGDANDVDGSGPESKALSGTVTTTCTSAEHHCMFVFAPAEATQILAGAFDLPCIKTSSCHVNLVMWAWHPSARAGGLDKLLVGGNDGDYLANGLVEGDQGRLMFVRERGIDAADREVRESTGSGTITLPTDASPVLVYSHPLKAGGGKVEKNERYVIEAKIVTQVSSRARFSTQMFLTKNPAATDGSGFTGITPESIGEHNGANCTPGTNPCTTRKVSVFQVDADINDPVYVNIIAKSEVPGGGAATVTVDKSTGWIRSTRYAASLAR
jgi:hypothetical protein